jgi:ArsR family transcriptional regulator
MDACCSPVCCAPLSQVAADAMASRLKALADPTRLRLFSLVASSTEQCACDLTKPLGVSQPTVSHHLKVLTDAGLLTRQQRGKWAYFSVSTGTLAELSVFLDPSAVSLA